MISDLFPGKRLFVFAGHFGSGKTEISINFALELVRSGKKVALVDMDIVNPFFRAADAKEELNSHGVRVITPIYANTNVDVPALPAEIYGMFENKGYHVVFDVGGDDLGARAVSRYSEEFLADRTIMFYVVNTKRPMTNTGEKIEQTFNEIQKSARIKFDAFVSNANLLSDTTESDIATGAGLVGEVAGKLGLGVAFCVKMAPAGVATPAGTATPTSVVAPTGVATPADVATPTGTATPTSVVAPTGVATPIGTTTPTVTGLNAAETEYVGNVPVFRIRRYIKVF